MRPHHRVCSSFQVEKERVSGDCGFDNHIEDWAGASSSCPKCGADLIIPSKSDEEMTVKTTQTAGRAYNPLKPTPTKGKHEINFNDESISEAEKSELENFDSSDQLLKEIEESLTKQINSFFQDDNIDNPNNNI